MMLWITSPMFGFAPLAALMAWLHSFGLMPIARKNPKISSLSLVSLPRTTKIVLFLVVLTGLAFAARALGASAMGSLAIGASAIGALAIGSLSLRVRALFFAMITLAVASAFAVLASQLSDFTGGEDGRNFSVPEWLRPAFRLLDGEILGRAIDGKLVTYYLLFAAMAKSANALLAEAVPCLIFVTAAALGFRWSAWIVVTGLAAHSVFDFFHHGVITNPGVPPWWPGFCLAFDVLVGGFLAARLMREMRR